MWHSASLFGHDAAPTHHAGIHAAAHESTAVMIGEHDDYGMWGDTIRVCHTCHAELQPHEFTAGSCADKDACCWRALSEHYR